MHTLFISDLHLEPAHPGITEIFLNFLQSEQALQADALYILGDFFAAWIGDDNLSEFNKKIIVALQNFTAKGIPTYFMHGNRDFLIGKRFLQQTGCQLLIDPTLIDLYGEPALLMHGDTLCTDDIKYLKFRRVARNNCYQKLFLSLPLKIREKIAGGLRKKSRQQHMIMVDTNQSEIERVLKQYNVKLLIHGHTHKPAIHCFDLNNKNTCRIVLSDWNDKAGSVLVCTANGEKRLETFYKSSP